MRLFPMSRVGLAMAGISMGAIAAGCGASSPSSSSSSSVSSALSSSPRIWLTGAVLAGLQQRAASGDAAWKSLSARCDADATGTVNPPTGAAYPNTPDIGQGYEGDGYVPEILALGLCYQTAAGVDATSATRWAQAGARVLAAMATPPGSGGQPPSTDDGYGIRNYGVGMAVGYDWLRPALDATTKASVQAALDSWISWYDASGFINTEPIGNYFAGYLFAKGAGAIALEGDDANATTWWTDVTTHLWGQLAAPAYGQELGGGGWPEGWEYGPLAVRNVVGFLWAANTGKGMTWWNDVPAAHAEAQYIGQFAWPSRNHTDDRGTVHSGAGLSPSASTAAMMATVMQQQGDTFASSARGVANDILAVTKENIDLWQQFLFWDTGAAATASSSLPTSYVASGPGQVAMRSSWASDATWASFSSGPYTDAPDSGEQLFDQGGLAIATGDQPVLVNATGWLPQAAGTAGETFVYDDSWGSETRLLNNTFHVAGTKQGAVAPPQSTTHVERFEDGGSYVRARGAAIEQMYTPGGTVTQFVRDVAYVRPGTFVVYDRTTSATAGTDQWMSWHVPGTPTQSTSSNGAPRFDVPTGGTIRALLPAGATTATTNVMNVVTRVEVHSSAATQDWLTTVTTGGAPDVERLSVADGNVTSGGVVGAHVIGSPTESVVLFPSDHAATGQSSGADYVVAQVGSADHLLFDVAPGGYTVTATPNGAGKLAIHVASGGSQTTTANGTLAFTVSAAGAVAAVSPSSASSAPAPVAAPPAAGNDSGADAGATVATTGTPSVGDDSGADPVATGTPSVVDDSGTETTSAPPANDSGIAAEPTATPDSGLMLIFRRKHFRHKLEQ